jgi:regulator of protease activity HflC (stomatin/prohibitin superfamily)
MVVPVGVLALLAFFFFLAGVRVVKEFERGVILRLGRYVETKQPGFKWLIPGVDKMYTVDTRIVARDVPPQDVITKDNVSVKVNAVIYFRVVDPDKAILKVENYLYATSQYAQTTLRSILGQHELDDILAERERINHSLQTVLDRHTDAWGVKVTSVELKHVDLPSEMQRAMAKQAEAERERRAKVIAAGGEVQASKQLAEAATTIATAPGAMTLRYLQTLAEIAIENNSTIAFPIPVDLLAAIRGYVDAMPVGARGPVEPPVPMPIGRSAPVVGASQPGPVPTAAPREPSGRTLPQPPAGSSPFGGGDSGA